MRLADFSLVKYFFYYFKTKRLKNVNEKPLQYLKFGKNSTGESEELK